MVSKISGNQNSKPATQVEEPKDKHKNDNAPPAKKVTGQSLAVQTPKSQTPTPSPTKIVPGTSANDKTRKLSPTEKNGNVTYLSLASKKPATTTATTTPDKKTGTVEKPGSEALKLKAEDSKGASDKVEQKVAGLKTSAGQEGGETFRKTGDAPDSKLSTVEKPGSEALKLKAEGSKGASDKVEQKVAGLKTTAGQEGRETFRKTGDAPDSKLGTVEKPGSEALKLKAEGSKGASDKVEQKVAGLKTTAGQEGSETFRKTGDAPDNTTETKTTMNDDLTYTVGEGKDGSNAGVSLASSTAAADDTPYIDYSNLKDAPGDKSGSGKGDRYAGLSKNDRLVQQLMDGNREASDEIGELPDTTLYQSDVKLDPITLSDVAESKHWQEIGIASETYEADAKTLDDMKFSVVQEALKGVDRTFVNPNNNNELDKLTVEQRSALLTDLVELKQNFNAYDNQYGDFVPNAEEVGGNIDKRIDALMNDSETQAYVNDLAGKGLQDYVSRPENSDLQQRLRTAYLDDIVGGKAIDRAMANGKSFDDALVDYNKELGTLSEVLPSDFTSLKTNVAQATLSQRVQDHYLGDGTPGNLDPLLGDGTGKNANLDKAAQALSLQFMADNAKDPKMNQASIKLNYAQDITRDADIVLRQIRNGMKYEDALTAYEKSIGKNPTPLGVENEAYKAGLVHGVQALTMSSVLVSRSLQPGKQWTPDEIAATVGTGVAIVGTTMEGLGKNLDSAGKRFSAFGTTTGTYGRALSSVIDPKTLESSGKILGAAGGAALAGLSFYNASRSIKQGEPIKAALEIIGGTAGVGSAAIGFTEAALQLTNAIPRMFGATAGTYMSEVASVASNIAKSALAVGGLVTSAIGGLAGFGLGLYDMAKGAQKLDKMEVALNEKLAKYTGDHVQFTDKPDPDFTW